MTTASKAALSFALSHQTREQGKRYSFGGVRFWGVAGRPMVADRGIPRGFANGPEHDFEITTNADVFGSNLPVSSKTISCDGVDYRVVGTELLPGSHNIIIRLVQPKPATR